MTRLTRKESHARTRAKLLATARELFLSTGYNVTSLDKVSAEAGFSKGAVYSNFATKQELGLAVLDEVRTEHALALAAALADRSGIEERLEAFGTWAEEHIGDVGWTSLEVEFATSNRHLPGMADQLAARRRDITGVVAGIIEQQVEELGLVLPRPAEEIAVELLALGIGLGVQRAFDPELPVRALVDAVARLIESATCR